MNRGICSCCIGLAGAIDRYLAKADEDLAGAMADMGYVDAEGSVEEADALEEAVAVELRGQSKRIADFLKGCASLEAARRMLDVFFDEDASRGALQEIFREYYRENIPKLANFYIRETDGELAVNQIRQRTAAWMEKWSEELSDLMQLSSERQMGKLAEEALEKGDSVDDLARRIVDAGIRNEQWQARRAALTEMLRAHSVAQQEAMTQDPSVGRKKWRHTGSYRNEPRKNHVDMDGQVVLVDEPYELKGVKGGTYHPMYPRDTSLPPEESINCHCLSQPVVDDDALGMSLEERQELQRQIIEEDDGKWMEELDAQNKAKAGIDEERETSYEGIPKTWQVLPEDADVLAVNPTGNKENCVNCTIAYEMRNRRHAVVAGNPLKRLKNNPFGCWKSPDIKEVEANGDALSAIKDDMKDWGDGARAQVTVTWNQKRVPDRWYYEENLVGHSFVAEQRDGMTVFIDVQSGGRYTEDVFNRCSDHLVRYCRIDKLEPNDLGLTACVKE